MDTVNNFLFSGKYSRSSRRRSHSIPSNRNLHFPVWSNCSTYLVPGPLTTEDVFYELIGSCRIRSRFLTLFLKSSTFGVFHGSCQAPRTGGFGSGRVGSDRVPSMIFQHHRISSKSEVRGDLENHRKIAAPGAKYLIRLHYHRNLQDTFSECSKSSVTYSNHTTHRAHLCFVIRPPRLSF